MVVNGFELPETFVQLLEAIRRGEAPREWELKEDVDAYGQPWDLTDRWIPLQILYYPKEIQAERNRMLSGFLHEGRFSHLPRYAQQPGYLADFTGVANFVPFGQSSEGLTTYAFDFGTDPKEPSVVYWDQYWRRVAPNFQAFKELFVPLGEGPDRSEEEEPLQPSDEGWEAAQPTPRDLLAVWTRRYVLGFRSNFEELAKYYARCSAEERRQVEAEVREKLERQGITDDQRRRHEELWARLHATDRNN